jgi:hypothetical protein
MTKVALRASWKENLYTLLVVAIVVSTSILFFVNVAPTNHTHQAAIASQK